MSSEDFSLFGCHVAPMGGLRYPRFGLVDLATTSFPRTPQTAIRRGRRFVGLFQAALLGCCLAGISWSATTADSGPPLVIDSHHISVGELAPGQALHVRFSMTNHGSSPVRILDLRTDDDGFILHSDDCVIESGATGLITAMVEAGHRIGPWWVRGWVEIRWSTSSGTVNEARHPIAVSGFVNSAFDPPQPAVDLGLIDPRIGAAASLRISTREVSALEVREIRFPDGVTGGVSADPEDPQSVDLEFQVLKGAAEGVLDGTIVIETNVDRQPSLEVGIRAVIYGDRVAQPAPVRFSRSEGFIRGVFEIRHRDSKANGIDRLESSPPGMVLTGQAPCEAGLQGCLRLEVSPRSMRPLADAGEMVVWFDDGSAVVVPFIITDRSSVPPPNLLPFLRRAELESLEAPAPVSGPEVRWEVAGDAGVFGYLVYRSEDRAGPFTRVNLRLVTARGTDPGTTAVYSFTDPEPPADNETFYYVDALLVDGRRQRLTGAEHHSATGSKVVK